MEMQYPTLPIEYYLGITWVDQLELIVTVISVIVAVVVMILWRRYRLMNLPMAADEEEAPPAIPDETPVEEAAPVAEGPGHLLVRFQALGKDFEQATKDLQRYNGSREVQLQGWQQLSADIIRRILPVLDNLEPYLQDTDGVASEVAQVAHGRLMTELATLGVTRIVPSPGEPFNGKYHQSRSTSSGYPPYRIKAVASPGYLFTPRVAGAVEVVVKPAEVIVESIGAESADAAISDETLLERMTPMAEDS